MSDRLIGVDVGGTKVSVAVLDGGTLSVPVLSPTETSSTEALVDQLVDAIERAGPADGVGLGVPSVIDYASGRVRASVNIPLADVPLRDLLRDRLGGMPVFVENDAAVAALAEADGMGASTLVMLTLGTGVGGGVVIDGRIFRGATGAAAELGHLIIGAADPDDPAHRDHPPQPGSLESLAAGRALDALARERGFEDGPAAVDAAHEGDAKGCEALHILGTRLGLGIANVINTFDPEVVAIGGGVSRAGDLLLKPARASAARFVLEGVGTRTEIRIAKLGPQAGVRGAALLAGHEIERETRA